jgi:hypothetical protein
VADGSALLDLDYGLSVGTLTFAPGITNLEIVVPVKGDNIPESNEVFYVYLNNLFNGVYIKSSATCTILDNGLAGLDHFSISDVQSPQQAGQSFPVTITALDAWNRPFTDFSGSVSLKGISSLQTFQVGTGKVTTASPLGASFHDSRTQVIYTTNDLPGSGRITALSIQVTNIPGQTLSNWTIRLKHTSVGSYQASSSWDTTGWSTVYQREQTIGAAGWVTFYFDTPFAYNGTNNLLVDFSFDNDSYSSDGLCLASPNQSPRVLFARTDSGFGDPLDWSSMNSPQIRLTNQVPNAKFVVETTVPVSPDTAGPFVQGIWTGSITVHQPATNIFLRALDQEGHAGFSNPFAVQGNPAALPIPSRILSVQLQKQGTTVSFTTQPGVHYLVERCSDLSAGQWIPVNAAIIGNGDRAQVLDDATPAGRNSFYRIVIVP